MNVGSIGIRVEKRHPGANIRVEKRHSYANIRVKKQHHVLTSFKFIGNIYFVNKKGDNMLKRKIEKKLYEWKNEKRTNKKCLVIKGARQVGKTYIIDKFCKENYENYVYMNFIENPSYLDIFNGDLNVDNLIKQITINIPNVNLVPNKTVIFLDEIQECPNARTALKFFAVDKRFDVIASGSLLGIKYKEVISFPVGQTETLEMYSLDFEEFLWANGISEEAISYLKEYFEKKESVPFATHEKMMQLFREYIVVGGMPDVVLTFVETHDFNRVLEVQKNIVGDYLDDIAKYAEGNEKAKARECFLSIPRQLAKDSKKFQYSVVQSGGTSKKYAGSLMWLYDAGIINFCHNLSIPELPLEGNSIENQFKVYMNDTGLLISMLEEGSGKDIIDGNLGIYKGAIFENIIAEIFTKLKKKLYYFEYRNRLEIDFFIKKDSMPVAVEVKAADNTKSKSLKVLLENKDWDIKHAIRLSSKNIGGTENIECFPLYMAMFM